MKKIKLRSRNSVDKFIIVDDEDYEFLNKFKWSISGSNGSNYAATYYKGKHFRLHRIILNAPKNLVVDHINHDKLDNRKSNLRICSRTQNNWNTKKNINNKSGFKGVYFNKENKKWRVAITMNGERIHVGYFLDKIEAAMAYDKVISRYRKQFAYLNFPITKDV